MSHTRCWKQCWAVILMAGQMAGCTAWRLETVSPAEVIAREQPGVVRVQYADEQHEVLYQPEVRGDSLLGRSEPDARQADRALALADVTSIATRHVSGGRTTGLVLGLVGVGAVVGSLIAIASMQGPFDNWGQ
jgi:hypothetical protein